MDFHNLIKGNLKNQEYLQREKPQKEGKKKNIVQTTILNTPLYRLYAENNRFETLNLIKPIKFTQRKVVDIEKKVQQDSDYLEEIKEYHKIMKERKRSNNELIKRNEKVFNEKLYRKKINIMIIIFF